MIFQVKHDGLARIRVDHRISGQSKSERRTTERIVRYCSAPLHLSKGSSGVSHHSAMACVRERSPVPVRSESERGRLPDPPVSGRRLWARWAGGGLKRRSLIGLLRCDRCGSAERGRQRKKPGSAHLALRESAMLALSSSYLSRIGISMKVCSSHWGLLRLAVAPLVAMVALLISDIAMAQYTIQWRQVGGPWQSARYNVTTPQCVHGSTNAFCVEDFRGNYTNGQVTTYWVNGCNRPPIRIQCTVQPGPGQPAGGNPRPVVQNPGSQPLTPACSKLYRDYTQKRGPKAFAISVDSRNCGYAIDPRRGDVVA